MHELEGFFCKIGVLWINVKIADGVKKHKGLNLEWTWFLTMTLGPARCWAGAEAAGPWRLGQQQQQADLGGRDQRTLERCALLHSSSTGEQGTAALQLGAGGGEWSGSKLGRSGRGHGIRAARGEAPNGGDCCKEMGNHDA